MKIRDLFFWQRLLPSRVLSWIGATVSPKVAAVHLEGTSIKTAPFDEPDVTVAYIPSSWTLFRRVEIPPVKKNEIEQVLFSILEGTLSLPLNEYQIAWQVSVQQPQVVYCYFVEKEKIQLFLEQIRTISEESSKLVNDTPLRNASIPLPIALFPKAVAMAEAVGSVLKDHPQPLIALDFDATEVTCAVVAQGQVLDTRSVYTPISSESTLEQAWPQFQEIARILLAWQEKQLIDSSSQLVLSGSHSIHLKTILSDFLKRPFIDLSGKTDSEFLVSNGAIELLKKEGFYETPLGFKEPLVSSQKKKQWLPASLLLMLIGFCSALLTDSIGTSFLNRRIHHLQKEYVQLLQLVNTPIPKDLPETLQELSSRLAEFDENFFAKEIYPHTPQIPTVSKTLAWLSDIASKASQEGEGAPLELSSFSYAMVRRPDKLHSREKYQVRVDVEFSAPTAAKARRFHELLLAPESLADTKQEVKWSLVASKWRAGFILKDSTIYLPEGGVL